ncbi:MAG: 16S rRNA (cytosine(967)-C(5))-methyltransferase RsmB [Erysipelotrichia bacterium]|nr:16S rRNA (cytosine(967)-C(5))-methyltransferase RsmB [Erysipelotrichia bacterium]NCC53862.1 16S rRNA (cytosine(967)-C(5))-methyltransferase RsmB [Erysipelotrichia bacterium]
MKARYAAFNILKDICLEKRYSNLALKEDLDAFSDVDKGLITNIVYGTLQHYRYVRYMWEQYPESIPREEIGILLDMSVYQLLFLDKVPDYAVVNEAVDIAASIYEGKYTKFVNAILHNVIRNGKRVISGSEIERKAIETSMPLWIVKMWCKQYGQEICFRICDSLNRIPNQVARVNTLKISKEEVKANNPDFIDAHIANDALIYTKGNIAHSEEYKKGYVTIQDESAQLVSEFLDPQPNEAILDMCAAPGSKTCHIGSLMKNKGELYALDIHEHRVELIKYNARRLGIIMLDALVQDATKLENVFKQNYFDRILLDGPCSGYGVIARKSDIKYHMKSEDMDSCIQMQRRLLESASKYLKVKGILVYSTCTLNKKENEKQIELFLNVHPEFTLLEQRTIFPYEYQSDGFYMAKLMKMK